MEWKNSTHAMALRDIQFQSELTKEDSPKWLCLNCHIPVQNLRESVITHLSDNDIFAPIKTANPNYDPELQQEGVTCISCHVRSDKKTAKSAIIGPNG
ncbi:MAG: cytochrome C554 and C-prime, partial [Aliifodinibius sp.]|nr:cytochrome C554 and C-prime [Fodinibius sp.]NIV12378.1 cytochrome C554 and C-prime [Fodinibius sp.]NIY26043.1 cytochrome C554 and C-prime [Fodinibius sp.]